MENKPNNEERLREVASKSGMTLRELNELFQRVMIDDEKLRTRLIKQQEQEMQYMQNTLASIQYRNATIENKLLSYKLERKVKWLDIRKKAVAWFRRKPKAPKADAPVNTKPTVQ